MAEELKFPLHIFFIVSNEFCERFSFYGMRAVLSLYLRNDLKFTEKSATMIYHGFLFLNYFFPVFGAIVADSWLGKFRTILYVSIVYALGNTILALSSIDKLYLPKVEGAMLGLVIISIGAGGIKPCVAAFGGDQFKLPEQEKMLTLFFSILYFCINAGAFLSTIISPLLRNMHCLGEESCFPFAFGLSGILMIAAVCLFAFGKFKYIIKDPTGNVILNVMKCMGYAIKKRVRRAKGETRDHWLDYADDKYDKELLNDIKTVLKIFFLYIPLPIFWALFDQQGTAWTFQASRMSGDIGFYTILPDQMQVINPTFVLIFIPIFEFGIYPLFAKINLLTKHLQRLTTGGVLAAVAFIISAILELELEKTYPILPGVGEAQIRVYNGLSCNLVVTGLETEPVNIGPYDFHAFYLSVDNDKVSVSYTVTGTSCPDFLSATIEDQLPEKYMAGHVMLKGSNVFKYKDDVDKSITGFPAVRTIVLNGAENHKLVYKKSGFDDKKTDTSDEMFPEPLLLDPGIWTLEIDGTDIGETEFLLGGVYYVVADMKENQIFKTEVTPPNSIHLLWMLLQYTVITLGEIMFSITGLDFSYSEAPLSLKSVMQAAWLLTVAIGNLIVVIIEKITDFGLQSTRLFIYAALMLLDMILFAILAIRYVPAERQM